MRKLDPLAERFKKMWNFRFRFSMKTLNNTIDFTQKNRNTESCLLSAEHLAKQIQCWEVIVLSDVTKMEYLECHCLHLVWRRNGAAP